MRRALALFVPLVLAAACAGADHYVYSARRLNADAGCLDPYKSIDFVNGDKVSSACAPNCFRYGGETFTSTVCPPLPDLATALDAEAPECKAAVTLFASTCGRDSGVAPEAGDDREDVLDAGDDGD